MVERREILKGIGVAAAAAATVTAATEEAKAQASVATWPRGHRPGTRPIRTSPAG